MPQIRGCCLLAAAAALRADPLRSLGPGATSRRCRRDGRWRRAWFCAALRPAACSRHRTQTDAADQQFGRSTRDWSLSVGTPDGGQQRAVVELRPPEPAVTVYVWLPRYPQVVPEDVISFDGRLETPPADGDFADYLARSGIDYTDKARTIELLGADGSPLAALEGIRRAANDLIDRVLPEPQAGLATAMAIGLRDVVAREVSDDFRRPGLSHVVAISGWHIAMLGAVVAALLGGCLAGRGPSSSSWRSSRTRSSPEPRQASCAPRSWPRPSSWRANPAVAARPRPPSP